MKRECATCRMVDAGAGRARRRARRLDDLHAGRPKLPAGPRLDLTTPTWPSAGTTTSRPCRRSCGSSTAQEVERTVGWEPRPVGGGHRRRRARRRAARVPARLRFAVGRPRPRRRAAGRASADPRCAAAASSSPISRTRWRRCSRGAGPTACPSCRRPRRGCCACSKGRRRPPDEIVAVVPPDLVEGTVEKVAINAVMAGCKPEYLPVVLACVEAACTDEFNIHGVLATTMPVGPVIIVNGPIRRAIGMNSGVNALGQGNRANSTIGRALQLVVRNVGGGRPGEVDRATHGNPGKLAFCFAEDEEGVAVGAALGRAQASSRGSAPSRSSRAKGPRCVVDQTVARRPSRSRRRWPPACARCTIRSCRSASTPSSSCRPSTPGCSPTRAGAVSELEAELSARLQLPGARDRPRCRRHRRGRARVALIDAHAAQVPPRRPAHRPRRWRARACSLRSSPGGPTAPRAANQSQGAA